MPEEQKLILTGEQAPQGQKPTGENGQPEGNNSENYNGDPRLDANGNPIEGDVQKPVGESAPQGDDKPPGNEKTGDEVPAKVDFDSSAAQQVETLLKEAGLQPQEVAAAILKENGTVTPAIYKAIKEKHGEGIASLVAGQLQRLHEQANKQTSAREQAVFSSLEAKFEGITTQSGSETWKELSTWAKQNISVEERKELNKLIGQGGVATELALDRIVTKFKSSQDFVQPAQLEEAQQFAKPSQTFINRQQYHKQLNKLLDDGHDYNTSPEVARLNSQREASRRRGY